MLCAETHSRPCASASPCIDSWYAGSHLCIFGWRFALFCSVLLLAAELAIQGVSISFLRLHLQSSRLTLPCRTCTPSQIEDPHLSVPRLALMTGSWHQRQNGPNRPPLFPHHAPHALPPTPSAALTWGCPASAESWEASSQEGPSQGGRFCTPPLEDVIPAWLVSLHVPVPLIFSSLSRAALTAVRVFISR